MLAAQTKQKILSMQILLSLANFISSVWISLWVFLYIYLLVCDIKIYWKLGNSPYQGTVFSGNLYALHMCKGTYTKIRYKSVVFCYCWSYITNIVLIIFFYAYVSNHFYLICFHEVNLFESILEFYI